MSAREANEGESGEAGASPGPVRLNLGAGEHALPGYQNRDAKTGQEIYPLPHPDSSVDEIRASHVLEHFATADVAKVLADWVRALKPGGVLKIAVPDFETVARDYLAGRHTNPQGYLMGGQTDALDFHKALFDREELTDLLRKAGMVGIRRWQSEIKDCAALPVSLNLMGTKPTGPLPRVHAVMSVPRLGFMDNFKGAHRALPRMGIPIYQASGAFWGQCLTRGIEYVIGQGAEYVLTIDYDTVFDAEDVVTLVDLALAYPEADAIAALQVARHHGKPLFTVRNDCNVMRTDITVDELSGDLFRVDTAHFGLTLLKASAFKKLEKPWLQGEPDSEGGWGEGREDDDVGFWRKWSNARNSLHIACRVPVGHLELLIRWPGKDGAAIHQLPNDFWEHGRPKEAWE